MRMKFSGEQKGRMSKTHNCSLERQSIQRRSVRCVVVGNRRMQAQEDTRYGTRDVSGCLVGKKAGRWLSGQK